MVELPWTAWFDEARRFVADARELPAIAEGDDAAGLFIRSMRDAICDFSPLYLADPDEILAEPVPPHDPNDIAHRWVVLAAGYAMTLFEFGQGEDTELSSKPAFAKYFAELTELRSVDEIGTERDAVWETHVALLAGRVPRARALLERSRALGASDPELSTRWARCLFLQLSCRKPAYSSLADWADGRLAGRLAYHAMNWWRAGIEAGGALLAPDQLQRTDVDLILEALAAFERASAVGGNLGARDQALLGWCYYARGCLLNRPLDFRLAAEAGEAWYRGAFEGSRFDLGSNDPDIDWISRFQPYGSIVAAWERGGELERARRFAQHWRDLHPDDTYAHEWLGRLLIKIGEHSDGVAELVTSFGDLPRSSDWRAEVITLLGFEVANTQAVIAAVKQALVRQDRDVALVRKVIGLEWPDFDRLVPKAQDAWLVGTLIMAAMPANAGNASHTSSGQMFANALEQQVRIGVFEAFAESRPKSPAQGPPSHGGSHSAQTPEQRFVRLLRGQRATLTLVEMLLILGSEPPQGLAEEAVLQREFLQWASAKRNRLKSRLFDWCRDKDKKHLEVKRLRDAAVHNAIDAQEVQLLRLRCRELLSLAVA